MVLSYDLVKYCPLPSRSGGRPGDVNCCRESKPRGGYLSDIRVEELIVLTFSDTVIAFLNPFSHKVRYFL